MKRVFTMLLLIALVFCTACGNPPSNQPPKDSLMMESTFAIADGKVTEKNLNSVSADYKNYYAYTLSDGAETLEEGKGGKSSKLTFAQLQKALDCLAAYTADPGLAFAGPYETGIFRPDERWFVVGDKAPEEFQWFFVYSVSQNTLTPLNGTYSGSREFGLLSLNNIDAFGNVTDGTNQGKWCYVFLDK